MVELSVQVACTKMKQNKHCCRA